MNLIRHVLNIFGELMHLLKIGTAGFVGNLSISCKLLTGCEIRDPDPVFFNYSIRIRAEKDRIRNTDIKYFKSAISVNWDYLLSQTIILIFISALSYEKIKS